MRTPTIPGPLFVLLILALLVPSASAAGLFVVAAADASAQERGTADLVCDGIDDQREINQAFAALPWDGGTVRLSSGTFACSDNLVPGAYTTLEGGGTGQTSIAISGYYHAIKVDRPYVTLREFRITDRAWVRITASHVRIEDVLAEDTLQGYYPGLDRDMGANGAFFVWAENRVVEDIVFYRCEAQNVGTHGFNLNGLGSPKTIRDVRFVDCRAIRCGNAEGHTWATGFDFHEANDLVGLTVERCYAADNWESGFHFEPNSRQEQITLIDCVSEENGWRNTNLGNWTVKPSIGAHFYMAGYTVAKGTRLVNCRSVHNRNYGFYEEQNGNTVFENCIDIGSGYGFKICKDANNVAITDCVSVDPVNWAIWSAATNNLRVVNFHQYSAPGRAGVTPQVQSMLGWYKGEERYEKPVTNSRFEITAHGSSLPILNLDDAYNPPGQGNTYALAYANELFVDPEPTPLPNGTAPPAAVPAPAPVTTPDVPAVHAVPGRIEAENYLCGPGTFSDTTAGNEGAAYRFDDVDIEYTPSIGGYNLGFLRPGEWVAYELEVATPGRYAAAFRVACPVAGRSFAVEVDDAVQGRVMVPLTGGFETYSTVEIPLSLGMDRHRLLLRFDQAEKMNLDRIDLRLVEPGTVMPTASVTPVGNSTVTPTGTPVFHPVPGRIPATGFSEAVNATPTAEQVRVDAGGRVLYGIGVATAGEYTLTLENASGRPSSVLVLVDGLAIAVLFVPEEAGSVNSTAWLPAGDQILTLQAFGPVEFQGVLVTGDRTTTPTPTAISTPSVAPIPGGVGAPTDTDGDGCCDDINGNGRRDFADIVLYFNQMTWIAANEPTVPFDFNANGRVDFADVVALFNRL